MHKMKGREDLVFTIPEPSQTTNADDWPFIKELKSNLHRKPHWNREKPKPEELNLRNGVVIVKKYPDPENLLDTAWQDFERFLDDIGISRINIDTLQNGCHSGFITIQDTKEEQICDESYCIEIVQNSIIIKSGGIEGVRRGIYFLEDLILAADGPFLKITNIKRSPWIKNRIARCFYGPIKRPPFNRDELMDDVDYYPDEYLNRLAHEGINVLWLTVEFRDIVKTDLVPEYGRDRKKRISKLRRTVDKCRRYGIRIFIFCIEPRIWGPDDPLLLRHPEVAGAKTGNDICFCPSTKISQQYLYEATKSIFLEVPKLGGMISITHGERTTSCLSSVSAVVEGDVNCPRCSKKEKGEILKTTHEQILRAMHEVNPDAQFISWMYMPQVTATAKWKYAIPGKLPKDTILIFNFESAGQKEQLGKIRIGADYWQSYVGPSCEFTGMALAAQQAGIRMGAKIQVGCSHEVATIPFVPVPSMLWKKYKAMYNLNVSAVIQSWYFGNYPGIMNKTAGELAFEDSIKTDSSEEDTEFTLDHDKFLNKLAKIEWGKHADKVVDAWKQFYEGYSNYPMDVAFQYYGPMHDGVVWPLHLFPVHTPLGPTWKLDFPTSGDSIGECMISFTIKETITLCEKMVSHWKEGVGILKEISGDFADDMERLKDIVVAEALGIQFESGLNILRFYDLRDQILQGDINQVDLKIKNLSAMESIVTSEMNRSLRMVELCKFDSRLGFHSEAEGYKYFPEKLLWRVKLLANLLDVDFPRMRALIKNTGEHVIDIKRLTTPLNAPEYNCSDSTPAEAITFKWTARVKDKKLFIDIVCSDKTSTIENIIEDRLSLHIKAGDLGYPYNFFLNLKEGEGESTSNQNIERKIIIRKSYTDSYIGFPINCFYEAKWQGTNKIASFEIDMDKMPGYRGQSALAMSIVRSIQTSNGEIVDSWSGANPEIRHRLCLSNYNPEAMGRLELSE